MGKSLDKISVEMSGKGVTVGIDNYSDIKKIRHYIQSQMESKSLADDRRLMLELALDESDKAPYLS